jgi:hypothetical protein
MANQSKPIKPVKGMGVTAGVGSDRYPYTILDVSPSGRQIRIQEDTAELISGDIFKNAQEYHYTPNPNGRKITISLRKDGRWREVGSGRGASTYGIGHRDRYYDPSF